MASKLPGEQLASSLTESASSLSGLPLPPLGSSANSSSSSVAANNNNNNNNNKSGSNKSAGGGSGGDEENMTNENQLSQDLALFLANPSLRAALADGSLDLASYSQTVEQELAELESSCISVYRNKADEINSLKSELQDSQAVLASLHEMLLGFQADLGGLSGEIRQLQEKSRSLDVQLRNRKLAEHYLRQYLRHIVIAPNLANAILNGPVNNTFLQAVQELQQIYKACHTSNQQVWCCGMAPTDTVAVQEMQTVVSQLRTAAVKRTREYFLQQMALLRRPQTNVRIIQVHGLLKYAALQDFLEDASPNGIICREIYNVYIESMTKTFQQLFRTYQAQLLQLDATRGSATRADVIAMEDALLRDSLTTRAKKRVDVFCLGSRAKDCLGLDLNYQSSSSSSSTHNNNMDGGGSSGNAPRTPTTKRSPFQGRQQNKQQSKQAQQQQQAEDLAVDDESSQLLFFLQHQQPILAHVALAENKKYPYERLFRSLLGHLVDAVTNEHVFCRQFFKRDAFNPLFSGTLSLLLEQLENYLFNCYDALCLLLMIKVTHSYRRIARYRKIHSLDPFFDQVTYLLWPRLKTVMENHLRSIESANATTLGTIDMHAHYVSRRMGEFCCSLLLILHNSNKQSMNAVDRNKQQQRGGSPRKLMTKESGSASDTLADNTPASKYAVKEAGKSGSAGGKDKGDGDSTVNSINTNTQSAGDRLLEDLSEMIKSFIHLLGRLSETHSTQKKRTVFQINNLDQIVCIFQERRVVGKEFNQFVELLMKQRDVFVEEELLAAGFSKMIAFVQQTESHMASVDASRGGKPGGTYDVNPSVVEALVLDFASNWKSNIEQINRNVLSYFSNFRNGMEILKQCLTQLLLYYTRFQDIIRKVWRNKPPALAKDLVSTNAILAEIKKYALAI